MIDGILSWFTNFRNRKLEWALSIYSFVFGILLALPPVSFASEGYRGVLSIMPETGWGVVYSLAGLSHCLALHVNGRAAWTPFARLAAVFINSQVFLAMALAFSMQNPWGSGVLTYGALCAIFCLFSGFAAASDCGREWKIWQERRRD